VLLDLLVEWEDAKAAGRPVTPEELCRHCPERVGDFLEAVAQITRLDPLLCEAGGVEAEAPRVPGFALYGEVGQGGMGRVYRARDLALEREVAIKFPHGRDPSAVPRRRFEREARTLAQLRHPNIVPVHSAGWAGDRPYFVMDYVPGGNLAQHADRFLGDCQSAAQFLEGVARGLDHAHRLGIVHRDLKPSNILIDAAGNPQVSDFGVAAILAGEPVGGEAGDTPRDAGADKTRVTGTGAVVGTPAYSAPEAFAGDTPLTPAADVWSLGVILYEVLTGQRPFAGGTDDELRQNTLCGEPPHPTTVRRDVPRPLGTIAMKCLAKDVADRYPSAAAVAEALAGWRRAVLWRRVRRIAVVALAALVVLGTAAAVWWPPGPDARHAQKVRAIDERLRRGEAVTLIGESGEPLSHRVRLGDGSTRTFLRDDGVFAVAAARPALVELHSDPGIDRFRLSADVRQDGGMGEVAVGLYWGHSHAKHDGRDVHLFGRLQFSDFGLLAALTPEPLDSRLTSRARMGYLCLVTPLSAGSDWNTYDGHGLPYEPPRPNTPPPGPWRPIQIDVTPNLIRGSFEARPVGDRDLDGVQDWLNALPMFRPRLKGLALTASPRGGVGLYVYGCEASFRNVRIEPLP
jgi:hypothetical protein